VLGGFNFFYAMPLPNKTLREVPFLKVFIIAFIWSAVTLGLPLIESEAYLVYNFEFYFEIFERFCWVILLLVPFEIRDYMDDKQSLKTLATVFGAHVLKIGGAALVVMLWAIRFFLFESGHAVASALISLSLFGVIVFSKTQQQEYFASFWVEGLPIVWIAGWALAEGINCSF